MPFHFVMNVCIYRKSNIWGTVANKFVNMQCSTAFRKYMDRTSMAKNKKLGHTCQSFLGFVICVYGLYRNTEADKLIDKFVRNGLTM